MTYRKEFEARHDRDSFGRVQSPAPGKELQWALFFSCEPTRITTG
jgi:hypothetical protein